MATITVKRHTDDLSRGDLVYHGHELLRVTYVGKWRTNKRGHQEMHTKFRRIGRINLDRQWRPR